MLTAIGLDTRKLPQIARDKHNVFIDVDEALRTVGQPNRPGANGTTNSICGVLLSYAVHGSTFHSYGNEGPDFLEDTNVYIDLGKDSEDEVEEALSLLLDSSRTNGMSKEGD